MSSSFKRRAKAGGAPSAGPSFPGTRAWLSGSRLASWGSSAVDACLGGGVALGSVVLVEEDALTSHYTTLCRLFAAEGVAHSHAVLRVSTDPDEEAERWWDALPRPTGGAPPPAPSKGDTAADGIRIAWRYRGLERKGGDTPDAYDLSKPCERAWVDRARPRAVDATRCGGPAGVVDAVVRFLAGAGCVPEGGRPPRRAGRVLLQSAGSPLWGGSPDETLRMLRALRGLLARTSAVCAVTVPPGALDASELRSAEHLAAAVLRVESFDGADGGAGVAGRAFPEHDGVLRVVSLTRPGVLAASVPPGPAPYLFRSLRRVFAVEPMSLPPEDDTSGRGDASSCGAGGDF